MGSIVILSSQRSGSNFLGTLLHSHPDIDYYGETLKDFGNEAEKKSGYYYQRNKSWLIKYIYYRISKTFISKRYWNFIGNLKTKKSNVVCFKVMVNQLAKYPELMNLPEDFFLIRLRRENLLRRFVSLKIAKRDNEWISRDSKNVGSKQPIHIDCEGMLQMFKVLGQENEKIETLFKKNESYSLSYEEFILDGELHMKNILSKTGLREVEMKSILKKQLNTSLKEIISNYDEVEQTLINTKYAKFLEY